MTYFVAALVFIGLRIFLDLIIYRNGLFITSFFVMFFIGKAPRIVVVMMDIDRFSSC